MSFLYFFADDNILPNIIINPNMKWSNYLYKYFLDEKNWFLPVFIVEKLPLQKENYFKCFFVIKYLVNIFYVQ